MSNPYAAPQSQPGEMRRRPKASHVFVMALVVFGDGMFFAKAKMQWEAQDQVMQAEKVVRDAVVVEPPVEFSLGMEKRTASH